MTNEPKMAPQAPAAGAGDQAKSANDAKQAAPVHAVKDKPLETKKT